MLDMTECFSKVDDLIARGLYASALWQCRLLIDVILHLMLKVGAASDEQAEVLWKELNRIERLDMKLTTACRLLSPSYSTSAPESLEKLIQSSRKLERGELDPDLWEIEARQAAVGIKDLLSHCEQLVRK